MPFTNFSTSSAPGGIPSIPLPQSQGLANTYNSGPNVGVGDEYTQLVPMSLGLATNSQVTIQFPGVLFEEEASNALSVHLYPNVDIGRVENMGRNPSRWHIRAALFNRIYPGGNETWQAGTLFPNNPFLNDNYIDTMTLLQKLLKSGPSDLLFTHPLYAPVVVQVAKWSFHLMGATLRNGCYFDIEMIETIPAVNGPALTNPSRKQGISQVANQTTAAYNGMPPSLNPPGLNLSALFGLIANTMLTVAANPTSVIPGFGLVLAVQQVERTVAGLVTGAFAAGTAVAGAIVNTPSYIVNNTLSTIQQTKTTLTATQPPSSPSTSSSSNVNASSNVSVSLQSSCHFSGNAKCSGTQ